MTNTSDNAVAPKESSDCTADEDNTKHSIGQSLDPSEKNIWIPSNIPDYEKLIAAFKTAEGDIKESEIVDKARNGLLVPAVNELRYCSYHIIKAIAADNEADQKEQLHRSTRHCERASFDALELSLSTLIIKIDEFKKTYAPKNVVLSSVIDDYAGDMAEVRHGQDLLTDNYKDKVENFQLVREQLLKIKKIYIKLQEAEPDIKTSAQQNSRALKLTGCGLIISLILAGAGWYKVYSGENQLGNMQEQLNQMQQSLTDMGRHPPAVGDTEKPKPTPRS